jgi:glycosyltransferase involved in cell wall biosynthesis
VETNFFCPNARQRAAEPTVLYAGRLIHEKDPLTLLKAFHRLVQDLPGVHLEMVGNGPLRKRLEAEIENLFLQSRVRILPGTEDIRSHFQRAWALVLPSRREASPNVILEAMATGLPVVSTPVGGIPELVAHGQTGILVEPRNTRALTQALNSLLSNESRRSAMGAKGREIAMARYSLEKMVLETEQVLLETAGDILPP